MSVLSADEIAERAKGIRDRLARAAQRSGRDPDAVALLAVTKGHPAEVVSRAAQGGLSLFGENRVAEGASKIDQLRGQFPHLSWRLIGPLQTNKASRALQYFAAVESLDRERLAARLEALLAAEDRTLPVLLEFNLGGEQTKSGADPSLAEAFAGAVFSCPHLDVQGLMTVPPWTEDPEGARPHFQRLAALANRLSDRFGRALPQLSMGMSHDFEVAVEEGSTQVRIGTALFGAREDA